MVGVVAPAGHRHADRHRHDRVTPFVALPVDDRDVSRCGVGRVVQGADTLVELLDADARQDLDLVGRTDDDEVVATDMTDECLR